MRTGAEYKENLRDGRHVWVMGEGAVADVTAHPSTSPMVDEYALWYDRHLDADWQDILLPPSDGNGQRHPIALTPPKTSADLRRLGKAISAVHFVTGGNMTHTPGYGALIALGMVNILKQLNNSPKEIEAAEAYLESLAETGRFLTFAGGRPLIGTRLRQAESERAALRLVSETAEGIVVTGKVQMHTSTPFAEDLLITSRDELPPGSGRHLWFIVPVNSRGIRVVARRPVVKHKNPFLSPLSSRFDELDAMVWLEDVFVPRSRVFTGEPPDRNRRHSLVSWLLWHHSYGWLAKAELTLGLALALAEVMGLKDNPQTIEQLVELTVNVQTTRTCMTAAELDPETTESGYVYQTSFTWPLQGSTPSGSASEWLKSCVVSPARRWSTPPPTPTSQTPGWRPSWKTPLAEAATPRCNERRSCNSPGTRYRRVWMDEKRLSSCMRVVAWRHGAAGWPLGLKGTTNWPMAPGSSSRWTCRPWTCRRFRTCRGECLNQRRNAESRIMECRRASCQFQIAATR